MNQNPKANKIQADIHERTSINGCKSVFEGCRKGVARLNPYVLQTLQLPPGDIIESRRVTGAKVWRADRQDWGQETMRIDSYVRQSNQTRDSSLKA